MRAYQQPTGVQKRGRESPDWLCGASLFVRIVCRIGWCVCVLGGLLLQALLRIKCMLICLINPRLAHPRLALPYPHLPEHTTLYSALDAAGADSTRHDLFVEYDVRQGS